MNSPTNTTSLTKLRDEALDNNLLIRLSVLTQGPLVEKRFEIREALVLGTLSTYGAGVQFDVEKLMTDVKAITKCTISREDVIAILEGLEEQGRISHIDHLTYFLNHAIVIPDFRTITESLWQEFQGFLIKQFPDYDVYIDKDARRIFDVAVMKILARMNLSSTPLKDQVESLPFEDFKLEMVTEIEEVCLSSSLKKKYADIIYNYFISNSTKLLQFVYNCYTGLINIDLLNREQDMPVIKIFENLRFLMADTNFIVSLLCQTDINYPLSVAVASICQRSNIPIYYLPDTAKETDGLIEGSNSEMRLNTIKGRTVERSQFVTDFRKRKLYSWPQYYMMMKQWKGIIRDQWSVHPLPESIEIEKEHSAYTKVYFYVKRTVEPFDIWRHSQRVARKLPYDPHLRRESQYEHDAVSIASIAYLRSKHQESSKKDVFGPWFLTFDSLLSFANMTYKLVCDNLGYIIQPRQLLNYLLSFSRIEFDERDKEAVAFALLQFTVGSRKSQLDLDDYLYLLIPKLGLEIESLDLLKEIILASSLHEQLEKAIELNEGENADSIAVQILSDSEFVERILSERETEEKFKRTAVELRVAKERIKELEGTIQNKDQTSSITLINNVTNSNNITNTMNLNLQTEITQFISLLDSMGAFKEGVIDRPKDISTTDKILSWAKSAKEAIEASESISSSTRSLLPYLNHIIGQFGC